MLEVYFPSSYILTKKFNKIKAFHKKLLTSQYGKYM
jgi:hypothetical protein